MAKEENILKEVEVSLRMKTIEDSEVDKIINEYMEQNKIDNITEEELTDIFGESIFPPDLYFPYEYGPYVQIEYYDYYFLNQGINPFVGWEYGVIQEYLDKIMLTENGFFFSDFEQLCEDDQYQDIFEDSHNPEECFSIKYFNDEYDFMKFEDPDAMSVAELEKSLEDYWEFHTNQVTDTIEISLNDISDAIKFLNSPWYDNTYRIKIHLNFGDRRFLVTGYDEGQFCYYKVSLETHDKKGDNALFLGSCINPNYVKKIIELYLEMGLSINLCFGLRSSVNLLEKYNVNSEIISEGKINLIMDLANQRYYEGKMNMPVEQALVVMLSIAHLFKFKDDYQKEWYNEHNSRMEKELEDFKKKAGIKDWKDEIEWIQKNGALQYHICIPDLLLQTLFILNGSYYRINDRDYDWEEDFYKIFVDMPFGREFDMAMLDFLLLPLFNSTHGTNYKIQYCTPINNDGCTQES